MPILHDTTYLQVYLLLCGYGLPVFVEDAASTLDLSVLVLGRLIYTIFVYNVIQAIPHFIIYSDMIARPRGLSAIFPSRKYRATILLAVDRFTPMVAATVK